MTEEENGSGDVKPEIGKASKIVKQVEYYFGDINLPRDRFLLNEAKKGWVSMDIMLKCNRLAKISTDVEEITTALSNLSTLIEVNDERNAIRRRLEFPLPENTLEYWLEVKKRTVYVKGFPQDETIDDLLVFFQSKGEIVNLLMRKTKVGEPRVFKGSVFVTFSTEEAAHKFAADEEQLTYKEQPLTKLMQEQYWANKHKEAKEKKAEQRALKNTKNSEVAKEQLESINSAHFVKGIVLKVTGLPPNSSMMRVKQFFNKYENVAFVKLDTDNCEALVRFDTREEDGASKAWERMCEKNNGKVEMKAKDDSDEVYELSAAPITRDEESAYWVEFNNKKLNMSNETKKRRNGKVYRGSKGKNEGYNRKRANNDVEEELAEPKKNKRIIFDDDGNPKSSSDSVPEVSETEVKKEATTDAE